MKLVEYLSGVIYRASKFKSLEAIIAVLQCEKKPIDTANESDDKHERSSITFAEHADSNTQRMCYR